MPERVTAAVTGGAIVITANGEEPFGQITYDTAHLRPLILAKIDSPNPIEFFEFFLTIYTADRLIKRRGHWQRHLIIEFPVTDVERWRSTEATLHQLIRQSTGDDLQFVFTERPLRQRHNDSLRLPFALESARPTTVALLSDGLDSYCGAIQLLLARPQERLCFVSLSTIKRKARRIYDIRDELRRMRSENVSFCGSFFHLDDPPRASVQERSQRSRTLLAIAAGFAVSAAYDAQDVIISENGLGILNLPVPHLQMAHFSSQVLHPANVSLWAELASALWGSHARLVYPNRFRTKSEMCATLPKAAHAAIRITTSCDAPRRDTADACGTCGSCIVRKRALALAGLSPFGGEYNSASNQGHRPYVDLIDVQAYHALELHRRLQAMDPWAALVEYQPTLRTAVADAEATTAHLRYETMQLLTRHVEEVFKFEQLQRAS